jgi:hypothetical protein
MPECSPFHYTPDDVAASLLEDIVFSKDDSILEPCKGRGNQGFYKALTARGVEVDWCEVDEGRDFFAFQPPFNYTKVISNPPYKDNDGEQNIAWAFIIHSLMLCSDECWMLLNNSMVNSLTPRRLAEVANLGFGISHMRVLRVRQWWGNYYWVCFKKGADSMIRF